jgi:hypothetical protein
MIPYISKVEHICFLMNDSKYIKRLEVLFFSLDSFTIFTVKLFLSWRIPFLRNFKNLSRVFSVKTTSSVRFRKFFQICLKAYFLDTEWSFLEIQYVRNPEDQAKSAHRIWRILERIFAIAIWMTPERCSVTLLVWEFK